MSDTATQLIATPANTRPPNGAAGVEQAIANAARSTSIEFDYLVAQAQIESSMNPTARARTSSASGLYQFIESTWLDTMKRHGTRFGLGDVAAQIGSKPGGAAFVADPSQRSAILALRNDPQIASLMAAGLAEDNRAHLLPILGRQPDHSELYLAHFLGAGGAGRFLSELQADPSQSAANLFRQPAAANRTIFYDANGGARSLEGVMSLLDAKMAKALGDAEQPASTPVSLNPQPLSVLGNSIAANAPFEKATRPSLPLAQAPSIQSPLSLPRDFPTAPHTSYSSTRQSMSGLFEEGIANLNSSRSSDAPSSDNVRRAYARLRAMGL